MAYPLGTHAASCSLLFATSEIVEMTGNRRTASNGEWRSYRHSLRQRFNNFNQLATIFAGGPRIGPRIGRKKKRIAPWTKRERAQSLDGKCRRLAGKHTTETIMVDLKHSDFRIIDDAFQSERGYCLNFSDRTFAQFFDDEFNIDIDQPEFRAGGTSKMNRLRTFLRLADAALAARVLRGLTSLRPRSGATRRTSRPEGVSPSMRRYARRKVALSSPTRPARIAMGGGGQPGMCRSTGMTSPTPPTTA